MTVKTGDNGYLEGLGMKVDKKKNLLWTLSNKKEGKLHSSKLWLSTCELVNW